MLVGARERPRLVPRPKRDGGVRLMAFLPQSAAREYLRLVARLAPAIEAALEPCVTANRVTAAAEGPPLLRLRRWRAERTAFNAALEKGLNAAGAVAMADVRECFRSIRPEVVATELSRIGCDRACVEELEAFLRDLEGGGVTGLPIGPEPSAVLANGVLSGADRALGDAGHSHLRWVDDFILFAGGAADADRALAVLRRGLAGLGLELAENKTRLLVDAPRIGEVTAGPALSGRGAGAATLRGDANALPGIARPHALVPADGGVGAGGRPTHPTRRDR